MTEEVKYETLDLINFQIVLANKGEGQQMDLIDIIDLKDNKKLSKQELDNEAISRLMYELISSRAASEKVVLEQQEEINKLKDDNSQLSEQVHYLLDKYNASENFIEENRGKLE